MMALFIPLVLIWVIATLTAYLSLLLAMFVRFTPGANEAKLPHYLRYAYGWGFTALGCLAVSGVLITVDFLVVQRGFRLPSFEQWMDFSRSFLAIGSFAAVNIVPTAVCWFWRKRIWQDVKP